MASQPPIWGPPSDGKVPPNTYGNAAESDNSDASTRKFQNTNEGQKSLALWDAVRLLLACALPTLAAVGAFSLMGVGLDVYNGVAAARTEMLGNLCAFASIVWLATMFVFDAQKASSLVRKMLVILLLCLVLCAAVFKGVSYPWAAVLFVLAMGPAKLVEMRAGSLSQTPRGQFYRGVGISAAVCAGFLLAVWLYWTFTTGYTSQGAGWSQEVKSQLILDSGEVYENVYSIRPLNYTLDCSDGSVIVTNATTASEISKACTKAETVWFIVWMVPFASVLFNAVIAAFCFIESRFTYAQGKDVTSMSQQFMCILVFLLMGMYCSIYASGASVKLASAFMAFFAGSVLFLILYIFHEISPEVLARATEESIVAKYMDKAWKSDWFRALGLGLVNVLLPIGLVLDMLRQRVRMCRDSSTQRGTFTAEGQLWVDRLNTWNWNNILVKVNVIGEIAFVLNLGGKFTFVFFSWLGAWLEAQGASLGAVVVLVYFVGVGMFLLPPVPGSAVYMFAGIVIGEQSKRSVGFWPGVVIASVLGLIAKLCACVGQYGIGFFLGKNVSVQKTIGVDTVPTRAIEKILNLRGMNIGKVAILVGGPDWPTSVTCGILRLNIPQMLLGTLPVFIASIAPQTLVGALLTKEAGDNATLWSTIKTASTGLAAVCQAGSSLVAAYSITQTIERDYKELSKKRPEHAKVEELTAKQAEFVRAFQYVSAWEEMSFRRKATIVIAASMQLLAFFIFAMDFALVEPVCFRSFTVRDDIGASFADGGLNGSVLNIVLPIGAANLCLFAAAVLLHVVHSKDLARVAGARLARSVNIT